MKKNSDKPCLLSNFSTEFYASIESRFGNITDHTSFVAEFVRTHLLSDKRQNSLLDIGAGPALILKKLLIYFKKVLAVDPNVFYLPYYKQLKENSDFDYIIGNFENIDFFTNFSVILCSHVLYHVPQQEWGHFISKILSLLETNGCALITLVAPIGNFHELCNKLNSHYSNSSVLCSILENLGISFKKQMVTAQYQESDRQKYTNLVSMFAIDDCFLPHEYSTLQHHEKKEVEILISDFVDMSYCKKFDLYLLNTKEEYITIMKS